MAARYEREGADELVFLDICASHEGRDTMIDVVRRTAEVVFMPLTVGRSLHMHPLPTVLLIFIGEAVRDAFDPRKTFA